MLNLCRQRPAFLLQYLAGKGVGICPCHPHVYQRSDERRAGPEVYDGVLPGPPVDLVGMPHALSVHENLLHLAYPGAVVFQGYASLDRLELRKPAFLFLEGDSIVHLPAFVPGLGEYLNE